MKKQETIKFYTAQETIIHSHSEIECIYVLSANVVINVQGTEYHPKEKDFVIMNRGELHGWKCEKDGLICVIQMDYYHFKKVTGSQDIYFTCNSMVDMKTDFRKIRYILDCIVKNSVEKADGFLVQSLYYTFWECVKNEYMTNEVPKVLITKKNERADRIIQDIREHYEDSLSLQSLSDKWFLSESAVSRIVKRVTGVKFVDFLRNVRLEQAKEELLHTDKSVTEIAYDCGFSNPSVFHKNFKTVYQVSPGAFRTNKEGGTERADKEDAVESLKTYLAELAENQQLKSGNCHRISVDCHEAVCCEDAMLRCLNVRMAIDLLEQRVQMQVLEVTKRLGVSCIRIQNPFDWELKIRDEHEATQFNFNKLDGVLDFCVENDLIPLLELPEKSRKTISAIKSNVIRKQEEIRPVISSMKELETLLLAFFEHIIDRYTRRTVEAWIFEIVYDVEKKTGAGQFPFEEVYLCCYRCIRSFFPKAKIGTSELNSEMDDTLLRKLLNWWKKIEEKPDFLSLICYPYHVDHTETAGELHLIDIVSDTHFVRKEIDAYRNVLKEAEYPETPLWITEWNTSLSERNYYNDSCAKSCHMLKQMVDGMGEVYGMSYGVISDCHASFYDAKAPVTGGSGLVTKDGLRKPSYYAMEFWKYLGNRILKKGDNYIITTSDDGVVSILVFNGQQFNDNYQLKDEDEYSVQELPSLFREVEPLHMLIKLHNIKNGKHKFSLFRVREEEGNLLTEWGKMKYVDTLSRSEISYLQNMCIPRMERSWIEVEEEEIELAVRVERNEIQLLMIF